MTIVAIISIITILVSIMGFRQEGLFEKLQLNPYQVVHNKDYHRIITHSLLHADWAHLIINMIVFFSFGAGLLNSFTVIFGNLAPIIFLALYVFSVVVSSLYSIVKNKDNPSYNAIGASGAVSAVIFANIFFSPWQSIYFFGVLPIPGIIFALLYLGYSYYMGKKNYDNVGHDAHFFGAVFGLVFPILIKPDLFQFFIQQLLG